MGYDAANNAIMKKKKQQKTETHVTETYTRVTGKTKIITDEVKT